MKILFRYKFKIFLARLINTFRFKEMWTWEYEYCGRCGSCYRIPVGWDTAVWIKINNGLNGCLCGDCAVIMAEKRGVKISANDINRMWLFDPRGVFNEPQEIIWRPHD